MEIVAGNGSASDEITELEGKELEIAALLEQVGNLTMAVGQLRREAAVSKVVVNHGLNPSRDRLEGRKIVRGHSALEPTG